MGIDDFLKQNSFELVRKIAHGYSSEVFLARHLPSGNLFALKIEKEKSRRVKMLEKEVGNLLLANSEGIGPRLFAFDPLERIVVMEFVEGLQFNKWLELGPSKKQLSLFVKKLQAQAKKLDVLKLDHGQLAGKGKNILARKAGKNFEPVIVDFEKGSQCRKCHNFSRLDGFLFKNPKSFVSRKVKQILEIQE